MRPQRHADKAPAKPWPKGKALFPEQKPLFVEGDDEMGRLRLAHHLRYTARGLYQEGKLPHRRHRGLWGARSDRRGTCLYRLTSRS